MNDAAECAICRIPDSDLVARSQLSKAFFPASPIAAAHIVVAVREHRRFLHDVSDPQAADLMVTARRIASELVPLAGVSKFYVAAVGDVDLHFHIHLLPRKPETPGLGPFIFGPEGWASTITTGMDDEAVRDDIRRKLQPLNGA